MDSQILSTVISGVFSLLTGLASIWLSNSIERRTRSEHGLGKPEKHHSVSRVFLIFIVGLILGAAAMVSRQYDKSPNHYGTLISLCLLIVIALFLAFNHRKSARGLWPYQLEIISLWFAYGAGFSLVMGNVWSDMVTVIVAWWLGLALAGGIITRWKKKAPMEAKESFEHKTKQPSTPVNSATPDKILDASKVFRQATNSPESETPLNIVKMRYAKGEITKEEFDQIKEDLT